MTGFVSGGRCHRVPTPTACVFGDAQDMKPTGLCWLMVDVSKRYVGHSLPSSRLQSSSRRVEL
jgi:hypothetical protein